MSTLLPNPVVVGSVLYGADRAVMDWVTIKVPIMMGRPANNAYAALGVIRRGQLVGGVVFSNYREGIDIEVSIAATTPAWFLPETMKRLFDYPFEQLKLPRISSIISRKNKRCRRLAEGIGWKLEGVSRKNYDGHADAMIYGMFKHELRIGREQVYAQERSLEECPDNRQKRTFASASA